MCGDIRLAAVSLRICIAVQSHIDFRHFCYICTEHFRLQSLVIGFDVSDISMEILSDGLHRKYKCTEILVCFSRICPVQHLYKFAVHIQLCIARSSDDGDIHFFADRQLIVKGLVIEHSVQRHIVIADPFCQKLSVIAGKQKGILSISFTCLYIKRYGIRIRKCLQRRGHNSVTVKRDHSSGVCLDNLSACHLGVISISAAVFYCDNSV